MRVRLLLFAFVLLASVAAFAQQTAVVIDSDGRAVVRVDLASGKVLSTVTLPFAPDRAVLSPDGQTVLALYRGPGNMGFWVAEFRPTGKSQAAVIRGDKLVGTTELGWGLAQAAFSADGRFAYVLTTGYESNKVAERKESELIRIDASSAQIAARLPFDAAAEAFATDAGGRNGIVYAPPYPKKKPAPLHGRLTFVDLDSFKAGSTVEVPGEVQQPVAVGDLLYVVDSGAKGANGKVYVVNATTHSLQKTIDLGPEVFMGGSDGSGRIYLLSQGSDRKSGRVTVVKGSDVAADYTAAAAPRRISLSADGKWLYVAGGKEFSSVDVAKGESRPAADQPRGVFSILATSDGRRAFVANFDGNSCCRISSYDVLASKQLTSFLGGSKGERIGQGLAAAALTVASYQAGRSAAQSSGATTFTYSIYSPRVGGAARGPLAFGPGEKKVYLVDTQTDDVTVVDVETGQRIKNIDVGSGVKEVVPLHQAGVIAAVANSSIDLIDAATDEIRTSIPMKGEVVDAVLTPDDHRLIIFGKERLIVLDTATAKEVAHVESLKRPMQVLFAR